MPSLFADTHNVVVIIEKSDAAEGFAQIINFLSGSYIHYALTVSPHIYISCIKQFWNSVSVKCSGDVPRLQALVDKKKIVISEDVIREILRLNDAEGVRFNFSRYIFDSLVHNVDSSSKLYMYPHFIQRIIQAQVVDLSSHTTRFISPALTQKVFANMQRVGKGFSGVETPLFENMLAVRDVDAEDEVLDTCSALTLRVEGLENANAAQQLEIVKLKAKVKKLEKLNKVKSSKLRRLRKVGTSQRVESSDDVENVFNQGRISVDMDQDEGIELVADQEKDVEKDAEVEGRYADKQAEIYNIDLDHSSKVLSMQEDDTEAQEAIEIVTTAKLMTEVVTVAATQVAAASIPISAAKPKILKIAAAHVVSTRKRKGVVIKDPEEELHTDTPAETSTVKDKGKGILIKDPKPIKKKDQIEMDVEYAKKLQE
nr:hypothetical protein [Tanacetum cinerariifolium]